MRYRTAVVAAYAAGGLVLAGCESSGEGAQVPVSTTVAAGAPTGFDPCTDIPQSVLDSEGLLDKSKDDANAAGGVQWRGCLWVQTDGYAASIQTTNITVQMVRDKRLPEAQEFDLSGREAIATRRNEARPEEECTVNVAITGGSLEFSLTNPRSNRRTGQVDTCDLARTLAGKVVAELPSDV